MCKSMLELILKIWLGSTQEGSSMEYTRKIYLRSGISLYCGSGPCNVNDDEVNRRAKSVV